MLTDPLRTTVRTILEAAAKQFEKGDPSFALCMVRHPLSWLVTAAPYLAGCPDPGVAARRNLDELVRTAHNPGLHPATPGQSLRDRLAPAAKNMEGASNPGIVDKALALLELASLQDHKIDLEHDRAAGKKNPLDYGVDYDKEVIRLRGLIAGVHSPEIDEIITAESILEHLPGSVSALWFCHPKAR